MSLLDALYLERGQSPWIDNIRRDWLEDGTLEGYINRGVRGVTSNPSIFAKALATSSLYDDAIARSSATSSEALFEELAISDVSAACDLLHVLHDASRREFAAGVRRYTDGFVSLEVSPRLAHDTAGTLAAAKRLAGRVQRSNLMIKIPATLNGLSAIRDALGDGLNVNVTLIFSIERYREVMDAYISGLALARDHGHDLGSISSVASFFVSRVDTAADAALSATSPWRGLTANSQVATAYDAFTERFSRDDAAELLAAGAQVQRPLWASTSTKNPAYDPLLYVEPLIANETVNTMPEATLTHFADSGSLTAASIEDPTTRHEWVERFAEISHDVDINSITQHLEVDGVQSFEDAYGDVLKTVASKQP